MNNNYKGVKLLIKRFCFEKLRNNQEPIEHYEQLNLKKNNMIQNAVNLKALAGAVIYSYLRMNGLNGKKGFTTKALAVYFGIKASSITSKVFEVDCVINRSYIFPEDKYEEEYVFIDIERYEIKDKYFEFLESDDTDNLKRSEKRLLSFIKEDPYFFDPYNVLCEYYLEQNKVEKAFDTLKKAYAKAMELVLKNGKFPYTLEWGYIENRHIIRLFYMFAMMYWTEGKTKDALHMLMQLLKSNPMDNIGVRYAIVGILEGIKSSYEFESKFEDDWEAQEKWFNNNAQKYEAELGCWFKENEFI